jgi:hypothetical protein
MKCPAGKYGNDPMRAVCFDCEAGYVCLEGATIGNPDINLGARNLTVNGILYPDDVCAPFDGVGMNGTVTGYPSTLSYQCPPGFYCPALSGAPTPCPPGTFNANNLAKSASDCTPCPANTFNFHPGQSACQTCGSSSFSGAGASTCTCTGANRDFNPTGKQCICKPLYASRRGTTFEEGSSDGITPCQPRMFENCAEKTTRNMAGDCLSQSGWDFYCKSMCPNGLANPSYDTGLGVCLCLSTPVEAVCNSNCRKTQQTMQSIICSKPPVISVKDPVTGAVSIEETALAFSGLYDVGAAACSGLYDGRSVPAFLMMTSSNGLAGVFRTATASTSGLARRSFASHSYSNHTIVRRTGNSTIVFVDLTNSSNTTAQVDNPVVCLTLNQVVFFTVSKSHYPVYDKDNLLNRADDFSNPFDQTPFLDLQSTLGQLQVSSVNFAYSFTSPGVAVLVDSTTRIPTVFVVMRANTACPVGSPFYPPTATSYYTLGVSQETNLLETPDWALIGYITGGGIGLILLIVGILILFKRKGWTKALFTSPVYRKTAKTADFDEYASKGSQMRVAQKIHPNNGAADPDAFGQAQDGFWDYERQVDLEGFDVEKFFAKLDEHSHAIQTTLTSHKDEIENLYRKSASQSAALKTLWSNKLDLRTRARLVTAPAKDTIGHTRKISEIQAEMERRKSLAQFFGSLLVEKISFAKFATDSTKNHYVLHESLLSEFTLNCRWMIEHIQGIVGPLFKEKLAHVNLIIVSLEEEHEKECKRRGAFCAMRTPGFLGGLLVAPGQNMPVPLNRLMISGQLFESDLISRDDHTGLYTPNKGVRMVLSDGTVTTIPPGYFIHPQTARVLSIEGSVAYNVLTHRFIPLVDNTQFVSFTELIPFIPFPEMAKGNVLKPLPPNGKFTLGAKFTDAVLGQPVPLLACTVDSTGTVLPVGGVYRHPFTGLPTPIEIGLPMLDRNNAVCPIVSVSISPVSGEVIPIGGFSNGRLIDIGQLHTDPLYGSLALPISGAMFDSSMNVQPVVGTGITVLDNIELSKELERINLITKFATAYKEIPSEEKMRSDLSALTTALDGIARELARVRAQSEFIRCEQSVSLSLLAMQNQEVLKFSGSLGEFVDPSSGDTVHILPGLELIDADSGRAVPILGVALDKDEELYVPLGGLMDDVDDGRCPISIGARYIDRTTERVRQVVGATIDVSTNDVLPSTTPCWNRRPRHPLKPTLLGILDEEIIARKSTRRRQHNFDEDALKSIFGFGVALLSDEDQIDPKVVETHLAALTAVIESKHTTILRERKRRAELLQTGLPEEVLSVLNAFEKQESVVEDSLVGCYNRIADIVRAYMLDIQQITKTHEERMKAATDDGTAVLREAYYGRLKIRSESFAKDFNSLVRQMSQYQSEIDMYSDITGPVSNKARETLEFFLRMTSALYSPPAKSEIATALEELVEAAKANAGSGEVPTADVKPAVVSRANFVNGPLSLPPKLPAASVSTAPAPVAGPVRSIPVTASGGAAATQDGNDLEPSTPTLETPAVSLLAAPGFGRKTSMRDGKGNAEKVAADKAKIEAALLAAERHAINTLLKELEEKRVAALQDLSNKLVSKLSDDSITHSDHEQAMTDYEASIAKVNQQIDAETSSAIDKAVKNLSAERMAALRQLRSPSEADTETPMTADRVEANLQLLAAQLVDFQKSLHELPFEEEVSGPQADMDSIVAGLNSARNRSKPGETEVFRAVDAAIQTTVEEQKKLDNRAQKMKDKMAARRANRVAAVQSDNTLTAEEKAHQIKMIENTAAVQEKTFSDAVFAKKNEKLSKIHEAALSTAPTASSAEVAEMIRNNVNQAIAQANSDRTRQSDALQAKLTARRRVKEAQLLIEQTNSVAGFRRSTIVPDSPGPPVAIEDPAAQQRLKDLEDAYLKQQTEMEIAKQEKLRAMQQELDKEMGKLEGEERAHMEAVLERERLAKKRERDAKFQHEVEAKKADMSEAEYRRLVAEYEQSNSALERTMDKEKQAQAAALQERLQERKKRKQDALKSQAELSVSKEGIQQERNLAAAINEESLAAEKQMLREHVAAMGDGAAVEKKVVSVLQRRHAGETAHANALFEQEKTLAVSAAGAEIDAARFAEKDELLKRHASEMANVVATYSDATEKELNQRKAVLRGQQKRAITVFDEKTDQIKERALKDAVTPLELAHAQQMLSMRAKQYKELSETLNELSPENALAAQYEDTFAKAKAEAEEHRKRLAESGNSRIEKIRAAKLEEENERRKAAEVEKKRVEAELEREKEKQQKHEVRIANELAARKARELRVKEEQLAEKLAMETDETRRREIIEQHHREVDSINKVMESERIRQKEHLQQKLDERRRIRDQRRQEQEAATAAKFQAETEARAEAEARAETEEASAAAAAAAASAPSIAITGAEDEAMLVNATLPPPSGLPEEAITQILLRSPFGEVLRRINDIESIVRGGSFVGSSAAAAVSNTPAFIDERELAWDRSAATAVCPVDISQLSATNFVLYRYGVFIARMLATRCGHPKVSILIASDLPPTPQRPNAFRNSYRYESNTRVLFVRQARMQNVGDLALVIAHGLAHVKVCQKCV